MTRRLYNQVANYAMTQQEINIAIGNRPPEDYMQAVVKQCNGGPATYGGIRDMEKLKVNLKENAVPEILLNEKPVDDFEFLEERRRLMSRMIRDYYHTL